MLRAKRCLQWMLTSRLGSDSLLCPTETCLGQREPDLEVSRCGADSSSQTPLNPWLREQGQQQGGGISVHSLVIGLRVKHHGLEAGPLWVPHPPKVLSTGVPAGYIWYLDGDEGAQDSGYIVRGGGFYWLPWEVHRTVYDDSLVHLHPVSSSRLPKKTSWVRSQCTPSIGDSGLSRRHRTA
ncbi:hypothetical protein Tco_0271583 [Tanacetum coccineum]